MQGFWYARHCVNLIALMMIKLSLDGILAFVLVDVRFAGDTHVFFLSPVANSFISSNSEFSNKCNL